MPELLQPIILCPSELHSIRHTCNIFLVCKNLNISQPMSISMYGTKSSQQGVVTLKMKTTFKKADVMQKVAVLFKLLRAA